jgi:hypothetical protein
MKQNNFLDGIAEGCYVWTKSSTLKTRHLGKVVRLTNTFFIVARAHENYQERSTTDRYARLDGLQVGSWRSFREHIDAVATPSEIRAQLAKETADAAESAAKKAAEEAREALKAKLTTGFNNESIHVSDSWDHKSGKFNVTLQDLTEAQVIRLQEVLLHWRHASEAL